MKSANLETHAVERYRQEVVDLFRRKIVTPVCVDVENRLRMLAHPHLKVETPSDTIDSLMPLLRLDPIHFDGQCFHIKRTYFILCYGMPVCFVFLKKKWRYLLRVAFVVCALLKKPILPFLLPADDS